MDRVRIRPAGESALLVECVDGERAAAWRDELWRRRTADQLSATEIVPGARTVLLDGLPDPAATARLIAGWAPPPAADRAVTEVLEIPVRYDGVDLADVADRWGVPVRTAVERLANAELSVAFCGFAPGFGYLAGLPPEWAVPRLPSPRPRVPAGSVGLAAGYAGIYPTASPGGWRLVGRTEATLFDVRRDPPALLTPGTSVRLAAT
ncbi:MAG TPA: allophanate hydrolase subunit 1 [Micromonosporaceae bacterium]